jgi:protein-S-isoprenylcysteine O-methyltransferase Ste14
MTILALILIALGFILRIIAMKTLGENWSLEIKKPNFVCKTGIYKYLNHPAYLGSMMVIAGLGIIHPVLGLMALSWAFFKSRIIEEDKLIGR